MNQQEAVQELKNNQQQAEMFNEVLKIISDACYNRVISSCKKT